jgi:hypothetical protein
MTLNADGYSIIVEDKNAARSYLLNATDALDSGDVAGAYQFAKAAGWTLEDAMGKAGETLRHESGHRCRCAFEGAGQP